MIDTLTYHHLFARSNASPPPKQAATALAQRCEIAEAEVRRLAEENAKLRQQYSEASDEIIQVRALSVWDGLGSQCVNQ